MAGGRPIEGRAALGALVMAWSVAAWMGSAEMAYAIDVKLTMEEAKKALEAGRAPMEKAAESSKPDEEIKKLMKQVSLTTRVGADPEKDPCGASAILRTKRYRLEAFGRQEATESKKQKKEVRMPDGFIQKVVDMPNMEVEIQLCGDDEYFADGVKVAFQQGSKTIHPIDMGPAERGRKNEGQGPAYRSRFTARFAYDGFDPSAKTKVVIFFPDGKTEEFEADFSKVK
ncbi:MAG: hypothetical protein AUG11_03340 [Nitrospirae bacterium 13_1_20CM_2_62_14]|nr:MAG: hypothetical protein AUH21_05855 [Nitrospirae bacterium 13_2_20CM_62_7]OLB55511.1 MAG: hypothetical protein AUI03_07020 [Nitrospirae bacterium 13_2_20CM_2_62_8]OLC00456.1 MAG: hypothetical protein AUH35_01705 [Nitrospirae bacterium 13_1_40CM_62_7]OLC44011.1 MAG: hypothetical protein AUH74_01110 [Nitrospirae bacterium 13_1_40CM_4_62_6]OLC80468.1 MAG: hypothetical protein AUI96_04175 [Nitrospirae bacterium 13_1_40CM_3_62_11]OLD40437.1 MAG: hypothetical protein AUI21_04245 [Nitrospirae ba